MSCPSSSIAAVIFCIANFYLLSFQIINVTDTVQNVGGLRQGPVNITFAIYSQREFLNGSDVSDLLRILNLVEFSFYLGFPVLKTAERKFTFHMCTFLNYLKKLLNYLKI